MAIREIIVHISKMILIFLDRKTAMIRLPKQITVPNIHLLMLLILQQVNVCQMVVTLNYLYLIQLKA